MKLNEEYFANLCENRCLSLIQATFIANSQFDLGDNSKAELVQTLSGSEYVPGEDSSRRRKTRHVPEERRIENISRMDSISVLIAGIFLSNDDMESAENELDYTIACLKAARDAARLLSK